MLTQKAWAFGYSINTGYAKHLRWKDILKSTALFYVHISTPTFKVLTE